MRFNLAIAGAVLPSLALGFPQMMGGTKEEILDMLKERAELEKREPDLVSGLLNTVGGLVKTVVSDVDGILGSVAGGLLNPNDKRPEPGYTFQAPGAGDSRGPCPGLNLLANYGYLPRNGYVNFGQVLDATARGFNMGTDLATVLATFAVLANGDLVTESFYLGSGPGSVGGLNRHSTVEADISPNREDYYLGCGDNHHLSSRLFQQNVAFAKAGSGKFDMQTMAQQYSASADFSKANNPFLYAFPFPQIVSVAAFSFYPAFFSNGTFGAGGVPNYESISSIIGAKLDRSTGQFSYVPEKWPENWYRRSYPYGAVQALTDGFTQIYPSNIVVPLFAQLGTANFNATNILCDILQGFRSITPLIIAGTEKDAGTAISWALGKLDPVLGIGSLGCPSSVLSPDQPDILFPSASQTGGPINSPSVQASKAGNNVYNKVYFTAAPSKPACS
ncbi:hypothetical protein D6C91_09130 [Aureobasidium pullulans]|uniref:Heme haloperoxidase family profile domain-containing protein n=1 Tax=Aureobasidium pullulans TaxID=5580 RepID=A0A4S8S5H7_AURPU|nr:hypothetical protein D6D28_09163 [Aureobasidium pullulans]THV92393.1 hypothetical protein D6D27_04944 [Aureobasidium pullulans]THW32286.1 hypothetical protein D6D21_10433 [Aureobasidium pullulans]THW82376.1 hypothetical protein D6D15_10235 [Aureobasidium pullulans]THX23087.1 hypothetical protein D6D12_08666 [Aureobasidium pullulans]